MSSVRTWWLTGASSGIGREVARQLAGRGDRVYVTARRQEALDTLVAEFPDRVLPLPADVSDDAAMQRLFASLPAALRPESLDGIILCAGTCEYMDLPDLDVAMLRRVAEVNYFGVANACAAALPLLLTRAAQAGQGLCSRPRIVGVCSMSVLTAFPRAEAYGSAKAAMRYFLDALRCDIGDRVDVQTILPGFVETPMTAANDFPMPFCLGSEEAAQRVLDALDSHKREYSFPRRLYWLLKLASWLPGLWYGPVMARLRRQQQQTSNSGSNS